MCNFVRDVGPTGGGDYPECYELVLRESYTKLNWSPTSQRSLVRQSLLAQNIIISQPFGFQAPVEDKFLHCRPGHNFLLSLKF